MALLDRINKEIAAIDRRIDDIKVRAEEEIKGLKKRRQALSQAGKVITPELETAVAALDAVGISLT